MFRHYNRKHKKSASCTAIPQRNHSNSSSISVNSCHPDVECQRSVGAIDRSPSVTKDEQSVNVESGSTLSDDQPDSAADASPYRGDESITVHSGLSSLLKHKASPFPLPSLCLFSQSALANESAQHQDIVRFLYPDGVPVERASMLISVLESLLRAVDEMTESDSDGAFHNPCMILCMRTFKVAMWKDSESDNDTAMVIIMSTQLRDDAICSHMQTIHEKYHPIDITDDSLYEQVIPLIHELFDPMMWKTEA